MKLMLEKFLVWVDSFKKAKKEPMNIKLSKIFINVNLMEMNKALDMNDSNIELLTKDFMYQIIDKRSEFIGLNLNPYVKIFLTFLSRSPGTAVMYLYYLKSQHIDESIIDMTKLTMLFPMGFPTADELDKLWDEQKVDSNNLLDMLNLKKEN